MLSDEGRAAFSFIEPGPAFCLPFDLSDLAVFCGDQYTRFFSRG